MRAGWTTPPGDTEPEWDGDDVPRQELDSWQKTEITVRPGFKLRGFAPKPRKKDKRSRKRG